MAQNDKHVGHVEQNLAALNPVPEVRRDLERLHEADPGASFGIVGTATIPYQSPAGLCVESAVLGRFQILRPHAKGGLGQVSVALDQELKREVALKEIQPQHADNSDNRERFVREAEITGGLEHPGIVPVYALGHGPDGRPFYAMRFVRGDSLRQAIDDFHKSDAPHHHDPGARQMALRRLLGRFIDVCNAMDYAHSRGVLHRDLKPGNIMVGKYGETLVVDWGLAKVVGRNDKVAGEETPCSPSALSGSGQTQPGSAMGTPAYMSPEQAAGKLEQLGPATDVYSLGATLYHLLCGKPPVQKGNAVEILARVRRGDFPKPSSIVAQIPRALEAVCLKAMSLDPAGRYVSPRTLADDLEHWLADEPVAAAPDTLGERLSRFARKHRGYMRAGAVAVVVVALVSIIAALLIDKQRRELAKLADSERKAKTAAQNLATRNGELAQKEEQARLQAQKRLAQIEKGIDILTSIFIDLDLRKLREGTEPLEAVLAARLIKAAEELEGESVGDPLVVAGLQDRLGKTLLSLGYARQAISLFVKAREAFTAHLSADDAQTLESVNGLASAYQDAGMLDLSLPLFEENLTVTRTRLPDDHPHTLVRMHNLADAYVKAGRLDLALPLLEKTLDLRKATLGADHDETLTTMQTLAAAYQAAGKLDKALPLFDEDLKITKTRWPVNHPTTLTRMNNLANAYRELGRLDLALPLLEETLKLRKTRLGADHPRTLITMCNLAVALSAAGRLNEALLLHEEELQLTKARLGNAHPSTLTCMNNLANCYQEAGKLDLALPLHEETLTLRKAVLGADHPEALQSMNNLANAYRAAGKLDLAVPLLERTLETEKVKLGPDHPSTLASMNNLAVAYETARKPALAASLYEETLKLTTAKLGGDHPQTLTCMNNLATAWLVARRLDVAFPLLEETVKLRKAKLGGDHPDTLASITTLALGYVSVGKSDIALPLFQAAADGVERSRFEHPEAKTIVNSLIGCQEQGKRFEEAETWRRKWLAVVKDRDGADSIPYGAELAALSRNLLLQKKWAEAEPLLRECLAIRENKDPDAWTTFNTQSMLGAALLSQQKYADAEPLLLAGYRGMKERRARIPLVDVPGSPTNGRLPEALERLVKLYEAWDRKDQADQMRKELEEIQKPASSR